MNTLIKAIILSLSSALVAAPVMAAPQEHHSQQHGQQQHTAQHQTKDSIKAPQHNIKKQNILRTTGNKVTKYRPNTTATALK